MAEPLKGKFAYKDEAVSDKGTVEAEITDALVALGELATVARDAAKDGKYDSAEEIKVAEFARRAKRQIDEILSIVEGSHDK